MQVVLILDKNLNAGFEVFGIVKVFPAKGYLKRGRFTPAYGIRLDDRNNRAEDTGFELGLAHGLLTPSAGVFTADAGGQENRKVGAACITLYRSRTHDHVAVIYPLLHSAPDAQIH
ncbi:MAG: hypothetical protein HY033_07500 [Ignavibacteriae bacterium]|nr:hypothetical protein [Ignavibacteria bacterium]MBI3364737.1 hypothetical protein [Ignavibacteriota bacterium]